MTYLEKNKYRRDEIDNLFVLVTTQNPRAAKHATVVHWAKDIMVEAGLGNYTTHSTHGASSTSAYLMGMPLDRIVSRVGWLMASTFIKYYMKPVKSLNKTKNDVKKGKQKGVLPDPHGYAAVIADMTPHVPLTHPSPKDLVDVPVDTLNQPVYGPLLNIKTESESDEFSDKVSEGDGDLIIDDGQELVTECVENDCVQNSFAEAKVNNGNNVNNGNKNVNKRWNFLIRRSLPPRFHPNNLILFLYQICPNYLTLQIA